MKYFKNVAKLLLITVQFLAGEASAKTRTISPLGKIMFTSVWLYQMWNSCKSVFPNTCTWELQKMNYDNDIEEEDKN